MFMAPKHYKLPLCIYLCCVWPAVSLCSRTGFSVPWLLMNTNYTPVSLPLNVSLLYPASPPLLAESRAPRSDLLQWISVVLWNTRVSSFVNGVQTNLCRRWDGTLKCDAAKNTQICVTRHDWHVGNLRYCLALQVKDHMTDGVAELALTLASNCLLPSDPF